MKILYITRKFPPSIGGMQTQSLQFYESLKTRAEVRLISWGHSQALLPLFLVWAFLKSAAILSFTRIDIIQLGDMVLSPLGLALKTIFRKPVLTVSHGRDSSYSNIIYDTFVVGSANRLDNIICVSAAMKNKLAARGIDNSRLTVIPNGIDTVASVPARNGKARAISHLERVFGIDLQEKKIILSVSRLVPKKGIGQFVRDVLPSIHASRKDTVLLVCGEGPESAGIAAAASEAGLDKIVHLVGPVRHDSADYDSLFAASDVFVMPNIRVTGDAEGFGLVALEAAVRDLPVVAYGVDGIVDVITDGINGVLIPEGDTASFARAVSGFLQDASVKEDFTKRAKQAVLDKFSWSRIIRLYEERYGCLIKKYC